MTLRAREYSPPSTLADVIGQVVDAFSAMADATPIMIGGKYLEHGSGSGPRVLFVPEPGGSVGPPALMGRPASVTHSCKIYVRGPEDGSDLERFKATYRLGDRVIDCVATAASGRVMWREYSDDSPVDVDAYGAGLVISFNYRRDVLHDEARWALPPASADSAEPRPGLPPGEPGADMTLEVTTVPQE